MTLNIKTRAVNQTLRFALNDEADQPLTDDAGAPCMCTIHGPGSKRYAQANARKYQRALAKLQKGKVASQADQAEFLADITDELQLDYVREDGNAIPDGREKFLAIYADVEIGFIAEQVMAKASDWANFSKGSAKS